MFDAAIHRDCASFNLRSSNLVASLLWTVPSYDIPFAFDHPQSQTSSTDNFVRIFFTYNRVKIMCAEHAPFIYGKDVVRKGLASVRTEATEDEEK